MRDRLQGRKKAKDEAPSESAQAPLQPAYFDSPAHDAEPAISEAPARGNDREEPQPASESGVEGESSPAPTAPRDAGPSRRRRSRGGRGRSRTSRPAAAVSTDAERSATDAVPATAAPQRAPARRGGQARTPAVAATAAIGSTPVVAKGTVVLAIGLPGSGKSSWFKRNSITPLSSDLLRSLLFDDPTEQRFQDLVFSNLRSMLKARLIAKRPMSYVDTTNLTPQERQNWIKLARDYGYDVQAVYFDVPLETCLQRNSKRERVVPEEAMRRMSAKLKAPEFVEGFSKITVVRVKPKEA
jgi:predicted kinase